MLGPSGIRTAKAGEKVANDKAVTWWRRDRNEAARDWFMVVEFIRRYKPQPEKEADWRKIMKLLVKR